MAIARTPGRPGFTWADLIVGAGVLAALALVIAWATHGSNALAAQGSTGISLSLDRLPYYALLSWLRMAAAYVLSLAFALVYAYLAAFNRQAERVLIPILDILQSIPILSFLPIVLVALIALFPHSGLGPNLASVILIFTSQVWNMVFSLYNGFITIPRDLTESARSLGLTRWQRFRLLELPHAMGGLVWNSMMSWAGGWFFLMAAEMYSLGSKSYRLQGLGSFLQTAANKSDWTAEWMGLLTLVAVIVLMDQLVFRPVLAWSEKFKMEMVEGDSSPRSAVLMIARRSVLLDRLAEDLWRPFLEWVDRLTSPRRRTTPHPTVAGLRNLIRTLALAGAVYVLVVAMTGAVHLLAEAVRQIPMVLLATGATLLRVVASLLISVVWTVPLGVAIGLNRRLSAALTPVIQIAASVPATALFPGLVALLLNIHGGLNTAAILLMMLGTQWYILFNVIAGASAIPEDLKEATRLFRLERWATWRTLILPAIFPYLITGLITASGGAWNASIVAEYVSFRHHHYHVYGVGWLIAQSSFNGHYPLLLLATATLALAVVTVNRLVWRPLYREASERYSLH
jgi:NitT/TauT family transport system permease protein